MAFPTNPRSTIPRGINSQSKCNLRQIEVSAKRWERTLKHWHPRHSPSSLTPLSCSIQRNERGRLLQAYHGTMGRPTKFWRQTKSSWRIPNVTYSQLNRSKTLCLILLLGDRACCWEGKMVTSLVSHNLFPKQIIIPQEQHYNNDLLISLRSNELHNAS